MNSRLLMRCSGCIRACTRTTRRHCNTVVESVKEAENWKSEKITFAAAYGNERVIAYLFLPKKAQPPLQTVVYFPGSQRDRPSIQRKLTCRGSISILLSRADGP